MIYPLKLLIKNRFNRFICVTCGQNGQTQLTTLPCNTKSIFCNQGLNIFDKPLFNQD